VRARAFRVCRPECVRVCVCARARSGCADLNVCVCVCVRARVQGVPTWTPGGVYSPGPTVYRNWSFRLSCALTYLRFLTTGQIRSNPVVKSGQIHRSNPVVKSTGRIQWSNPVVESTGQIQWSNPVVKSTGRIHWLNPAAKSSARLPAWSGITERLSESIGVCFYRLSESIGVCFYRLSESIGVCFYRLSESIGVCFIGQLINESIVDSPTGSLTDRRL
jgi:hypothetical protein